MRDWVAELGLEPHTEGGYFRRIYTSEHRLSLPRGARPAATSIYYLLTRDEPRGRLHRNRSDILHFLVDGGPVEYVTLAPDGSLDRVRLGADDERFLLVPGGHWKASTSSTTPYRASSPRWSPPASTTRTTSSRQRPT